MPIPARFVCPFVVGLAGASGCSEAGGGAAPARPPVPVSVTTVAPRTFVEEVVALGTLSAHESVVMTANVTEKVARIHFTDGQRVEDGDVLVELVRAEESSNFQEARASLTREELELERVATLAKDAIATRSELDTHRTRVETARARLQAIEAQLGDRLIRAPFTGRVGLRRVSPGSLVTPSTVITTIDALDWLYADLPIPERSLARVAPGQSVRLESDAFAGDSFTGDVVAVDARVDPSTRAVMVRARVENPGTKLLPGMLVRARLAIGQRTSPAVPETALLQRGYRSLVYVVELGAEPGGAPTVQLVEVGIGYREPGWIEILSGLKEGQRVVLEGTNRVQPGAKVEIVAESSAAPTAREEGGIAGEPAPAAAGGGP